jgi:hypothetical protein
LTGTLPIIACFVGRREYKRRKRKGKYCESELRIFTAFIQEALRNAGKVEFAPKVILNITTKKCSYFGCV